MNRHYEMLIDGHFVGGPCDYAVGKLVVSSPFDGRHVGTAAEGGWDEMNAALNAATGCFRAFRDSAVEERAQVLLRTAELVRERESELAELMVAEIGKPRPLAVGEIRRTALTFELAARECLSFRVEPIDISYDSRATGFAAKVGRFPVGPVLGIVPYNWPLNLAAHKIGPALAVGCPIVVKPSNQAPLSTLALVRLLHEAGTMPGSVNAVVCVSAIAQKAALDPRVKKLSFTGSPGVGWKLKELLPAKRVTLELGGDAFAIVHEDAGDLDAIAAKLVAGSFGYAGQVCISVQHLLVHRIHFEALLSKMVELVRRVPYGDPSLVELCGPLISVEAADRVRAWISEAVTAGARVVAQSEALVGSDAASLVPPTLMTGVPASVKLGCEEVFGPVVDLIPYDTLDEAIGRVNSSQYGIHCGAFTQSREVAERLFQELEVAGVVINENPTFRLDVMPYGGVKRSGFGREGVPYAMEEMTELKSLVAGSI